MENPASTRQPRAEPRKRRSTPKKEAKENARQAPTTNPPTKAATKATMVSKAVKAAKTPRPSAHTDSTASTVLNRTKAALPASETTPATNTLTPPQPNASLAQISTPQTLAATLDPTSQTSRNPAAEASTPQTTSQPGNLAEVEVGLLAANTRKQHGVHPFLQLLVQHQHISRVQAENIQKQLTKRGSVLEKNVLSALKNLLIHQNKLIQHEVFQQTQATLLNLPFDAHVDKNLTTADLAHALPIQYAKQHALFPIKKENGVIDIAVENAWDWHAIDDVARHLNGSPNVIVSTRTAIFQLINHAYHLDDDTAGQVIESLDNNQGAEGLDWALDEPEDLLEAQDDEPIKRLLNSLLHQAVKSRVSDVHIEATNTNVTVRYRIDGTLQVVGEFPKAIHRSLINRIKIMSQLDIAQHGLPQDGRTLVIIASKKVDIRVSTMPTVHGEKAVLRILPQEQAQFELTALGMPEKIRAEIERLLSSASGMFLVTGPTGSGKTTTLYAALNTLNRESSNIMTIEDPVEYRIAGYVQTEVNVKTGLTFANALRSVLRQDPDVIMVGEMRDTETALIAIQASLTGHFVFSTLHTNSAAATLTRLVDMGVEPYLASSTVRGVLAQRLVRRLCSHCQKPAKSTLAIQSLRQLNTDFDTCFEAHGCEHCIAGTSGRVGVFELLHMSRGIQEILKTTTESHAIADVARADGMIPMREWALHMVKDGIISAEEALRLVNSADTEVDEN